MVEFDFHVHSKYSFDSILKIEKIVKTAKKKGLAGVAITDHGTIKGGLSGQKYNKDDFLVIVGTEINTDMGDIIGLFLNEEITVNEIWRVIDCIHDQDGFVILPHPFRGHDLDKFGIQLFNQFEGIEVYNARTNEKDNMKVKELVRKYGLSIVAGSDAHFAREIGLAKTIIKGDISSEDDIRNAILNNETRFFGRSAPLFFLYASSIIKNIKAMRH